MLLTLKTKLQPSPDQRAKLLRTIETFNAACEDISKIAYETRARRLLSPGFEGVIVIVDMLPVATVPCAEADVYPLLDACIV